MSHEGQCQQGVSEEHTGHPDAVLAVSAAGSRHVRCMLSVCSLSALGLKSRSLQLHHLHQLPISWSARLCSREAQLRDFQGPATPAPRQQKVGTMVTHLAGLNLRNFVSRGGWTVQNVSPTCFYVKAFFRGPRLRRPTNPDRTSQKINDVNAILGPRGLSDLFLLSSQAQGSHPNKILGQCPPCATNPDSCCSA